MAEPYIQSQIPLLAFSTGAAQINNVLLTPATGFFAYISGFEITGGGATAASFILISISGLATTLQYQFFVPAGAAVQAPPLIVTFGTPIRANVVGASITVGVPSFGAGNTNASVSAHGFQSQI